MVLSKQEAELFFKLWLPLLRYGSEAYDLHAGKLVKPSGEIDLYAAMEVAVAIWEDVTIIDEYLFRRTDMNQAERDLVLNWKHAIHGPFALERNLRGGSIFISLDNNEVYLVKGITSIWQEMFDGQPMPVILTTTLLPFKGTIITDGLINAGNIAVGPGIRRDLKDTYMRAKDLGRIVKSLV